MADDAAAHDKRRAERVPVNFAVSFTELSEDEASRLAGIDPVAELPVQVPARSAAPAAAHAACHPSSPVPGRTENLSQGGLSLTGDLHLLGEKRLERGKKLLVQFELPGEATPVKAVAVVAWSLEGSGAHSKFTAGLMFLGISPQDLEKIGRYVEGHNTGG